ncbi:MAG: hypothetical protein COA69_09475 [Robiginitomaculum sp.]|nr:MAG: hypothetical protein COA69_09475 [Robiginitomaculum sp.]
MSRVNYGIFRSALLSQAPLTCVEYADLPKPRITTLAAMLLPDTLLTHSLSRDQLAIARFNDKLTKGPRSGSCIAYSFEGDFTMQSVRGDRQFVGVPKTMWLIDSKRVDCSELPFSAVDFTLVLGAESIDPDVLRHFERCSQRMMCIGNPGRAGSYWYDLARKGELHRFTGQQIVERYPDQEPFLLAEDDFDYPRMMNCEDEVLGQRAPFRVFAKRRLKVRTDKTKAFLTKLQQAEAATQHGIPVVTLELSKLQQRYLAKKRLSRMQGKKEWFLLLKYRRGGFTTLEQGQNYEVSTTVPRSQVACLAHTRESTARIFRIAKLYQELDPRGLPLVGDSKSELSFANGSLYHIGTAGATGFARGDTLQRVHGSEVSKWCHSDMDKVDDLMAGIMGACEHGEIVLETTPNGIEWFASKYRDAKLGLNDFTPIFLRWFDDPTNQILDYDGELILDTLTDHEKSLVERFGLSLPQLAFRRDRKRNFGVLFPQEYPEDDETCFLVSGTPYFDQEFILDFLEKMNVDSSVQSIPGGQVTTWEDPIPGVKYVLGSDTSEGLPGCDPNGVGVIRRDTGAQVCSAHGLFDPRRLADVVCEVARKYNKAMIGVERENHGHAVLQRIIDLGISSPHYKGGQLYYFSRVTTKGSKSNQERRARAGWSTNAATRPVMLDQLSEWMTAPGAEDRIRDRDFLGEALTFRLQGNGKYSADPGCHDDSVMKWAVAVQMLNVRQSKPEIILA